MSSPSNEHDIEEGLECLPPLTQNAPNPRSSISSITQTVNTNATAADTTTLSPALELTDTRAGSPVQGAANHAAPAIPSTGLELAVDRDEPPPPTGIMEAILDADKSSAERHPNQDDGGGLELANEDDVGPHPPAGMPAESSVDCASQRTVASKNMGKFTEAANLQHTGDDGAPTPFNSAEFEEEKQTKKELAACTEKDSIIIPTADGDEEMDEDEVESTTNSDEDGSTDAHGDDFIGVVNDTEDPNEENAPIPSDVEDDATVRILNAWPVPEGNVETAGAGEVPVIDAVATPIEPWRKQKRTKLLMLFVFAVVLAAAIAVGVSLSSSEAPSAVVTEIIVGSDAPSISTDPSSFPSPRPTVAASSFPSVTPTIAPSSSLPPSSPPSACGQTISSQAQVVDLGIDHPRNTKVAVDGTNMVVVVKDSYTRKVRIALNKVDTSLELAEVKVFDENGDNRARLAPASHSSQFYGLVSPHNTADQTDFSASKAVDGIVHTFSHTTDDDADGAWFEVDLGEAVHVDRVEIWSRRDCCQDRLTHATVSLINEKGRAWAAANIDGTARFVHSLDSDAFSTTGAVDDTSVHLMFFSLTNDGWEIVDMFSENSYGGEYGVALSGKTAFVGFPFAEGATAGAGSSDAGAVIYYEQDESSGVWTKTEEPLIPGTGSVVDHRFGSSVDIDGDLACVVAAASSGATYIFRREIDSTRWGQIARLDIESPQTCSIAGSSIAVQSREGDVWLYQYDQNFDGFSSPREPYLTNVKSMTLSVNCFVHLDRSTNSVIIRNRDEENQHSLFAHHQQFDASYYRDNLALENDVLVIGGLDRIHILSEQSGYWRETITLNHPYDDYKLSGRIVLATLGNEVYSLNIEGCTQAMPTHMPSVSMAPTTCYSIEIAIVYDWNPQQTSWDLQRIDADGNVATIMTHTAAGGDPSYAETFCLLKGDYEFILYDSRGTGICCESGEGHYQVTSSNGALIAKGGEFGWKESTMFSLPFVPSAAPSIGPSAAPSITPPSVSPTLSSSPTDACYFVEVDVFSDDYPNETHWNISSVPTADGSQKYLVRDSSLVELQVDGKHYSTFHIENSAAETSVNGVLCGCGFGTSQCECQNEVCLIERGNNDFYEKVANCEGGGGLAAIIYNDGGEAITKLGHGHANISAAFINQDDGKHLVENSLGERVTMTASSSWRFNANALNSRTFCLPEGDYEFAIYDSYGDGLCCGEGQGYYNVTTSSGALIVQGGDFQESEAIQFSLPFVPAPSEMPSATLVPSSSSSPSSIPSSSQFPSVSLSPFASPSSSPTETCFFVEINVFADYHPKENWWDVFAIVNVDGTQEKHLAASSYHWIFDASTLNSGRVCLPKGEYEFVIYDSTGNGICCWWGGFFPKPAIEGHYNVTSNGALIAEGGEFEWEDAARFTLPFIPSQSNMPSASIRPSSSSSPSMSLRPSMKPSITPPSITPSTSIPPTAPCFLIEVNTLSDYIPSEYEWTVSSIVSVNGILKENLIYDSTRQVVLRVDAKLYDAFHIENSASGTSVSGVLCDCGFGTSQCKCEGKVCLIERGSSYIYEKVANCESGGGLAAIIYNNDREMPKRPTLGKGLSANIPAAFIIQADGKYLVRYGLGDVATVAAFSLLGSNGNASRWFCLPGGEYVFKIDDYYDGFWSKSGEGHYKISTSNALIAQGGVVEEEETTRFFLPFVPAPSAVPSVFSRAPSSSLFPSISRPPSMAPSTTLPSITPSLSSFPTETCFFIAVSVFSDFSRWATHWTISTLSTVNGTQEKNIVYDSNGHVLLQVEEKFYSTILFENSATDTSVNGLLCDCGLGTSQCKCPGKVCLIERGSNYFFEKIANCEGGGGLAAIIHNNVEDETRRSLQGHNVHIPTVFINQADGQYLVEHGLGEDVEMTVSSPFQFEVNILNSRRLCLPEGDYEFQIYNYPSDHSYILGQERGEGHYNVTTSNGILIAQGGKLAVEETTRFSLPFVKSRKKLWSK